MLNKFVLISKWIEEYFSRCDVKRTYADNNKIFLITGHRGSPTFEPENTIPSFERAMADGANSLEADICLTRDHEVVLWHDWNPDSARALLREGGFEPFVKYKPHPPAMGSEYRRKITDLTLDEFRENYTYKEKHGKGKNVHPSKPKLSEFFIWGSEQKNLKFIFLDVKTPDEDTEYAIPVVEEIKRLKEKFSPSFNIVIETNQKNVFTLLRNKYPELSFSLDIEPRPGIILMPRQYSTVRKAIKYKNRVAVGLRPRKITIANWTTYRRIMKYDARLRALYNKRHNEQKIERLIAATVNKYTELDCLVKLGVDGIQTDFPHRLKEIAEKYGRKTEDEVLLENKVF